VSDGGQGKNPRTDRNLEFTSETKRLAGVLEDWYNLDPIECESAHEDRQRREEEEEEREAEIAQAYPTAYNGAEPR